MTNMATRRAWTIVVGLAVLGATIMGTPVSAKPGKPGTGERNCVIELVKGSNKAASTTCFDGFSQAINFATQGRVADASAPGAGPDGSLDRRIQESNRTAAVTPNAVYVLSIEYFDTAGVGPALVFLGATQCTSSTTDVDYGYILEPVDWDQISSFYTSYCWVDHHYWQDFFQPNTSFRPCGGHHCPLPPMNPGNIPADNNTRALRWT